MYETGKDNKINGLFPNVQQQDSFPLSQKALQYITTTAEPVSAVTRKWQWHQSSTSVHCGMEQDR